jgi:Fe2+ or Zn2+ uptake regulation protein
MSIAFSPETILKDAGFRVTTGRVAVLHLLEQSPTPLSIQDILKQVKHVRLDQATVYRMLTALREKGLVQLVNMEHDHAHWELAGHHHHAVCESCGKVLDISKCDLHRLEEEIKTVSGFASLHRHSLEFFGLCAACAKKSR